METNIEDLIGRTFYKKKGLTDKDKETLYLVEECGVEEVKSAQFLGLLFTANWCPPCKCFLSVLKEFYNEVNIDKKQCEILNVPMDKSEDEYKEHYS